MHVACRSKEIIYIYFGYEIFYTPHYYYFIVITLS